MSAWRAITGGNYREGDANLLVVRRAGRSWALHGYFRFTVRARWQGGRGWARSGSAASGEGSQGRLRAKSAGRAVLFFLSERMASGIATPATRTGESLQACTCGVLSREGFKLEAKNLMLGGLGSERDGSVRRRRRAFCRGLL